MWSGLTLGRSLLTSSHCSFSISYKSASCRDALFLCTKTFCLVFNSVKILCTGYIVIQAERNTECYKIAKLSE